MVDFFLELVLGFDDGFILDLVCGMEMDGWMNGVFKLLTTK